MKLTSMTSLLPQTLIRMKIIAYLQVIGPVTCRKSLECGRVENIRHDRVFHKQILIITGICLLEMFFYHPAKSQNFRKIPSIFPGSSKVDI